jgi:hypothetical protein
MIINTFLGMACCLTFVTIVTRRRASAQVLAESVINT